MRTKTQQLPLGVARGEASFRKSEAIILLSEPTNTFFQRQTVSVLTKAHLEILLLSHQFLGHIKNRGRGGVFNTCVLTHPEPSLGKKCNYL